MNISTGPFIDPDGGAITVTATGLPEGLTIDPVTGEISGELGPEASKNGHYTILVTGTDTQGKTVSYTLTLGVTNPAPQILAELATQTVTDGSNISIETDVFTDPDGSPFTITATGLPAGLIIDPVTGKITGTLAPDASRDGPYQIAVTATDPQGATVTTTFTLDVDNIPIVQTGKIPNQANSAGETIEPIDANVFWDGDKDDLSFSAQGLPLGLSIDPNTGKISGTLDPSLRSGVQYEVTVFVDDGNGSLKSVTFLFDIMTSANSGDANLSSPIANRFAGGQVKTAYQAELLIAPEFDIASEARSPNVVIRSVDELNAGVLPEIDADHPVGTTVEEISDNYNSRKVKSDLQISGLIKKEFAKLFLNQMDLSELSGIQIDERVPYEEGDQKLNDVYAARMSTVDGSYFKIYAREGMDVRIISLNGDTANLLEKDLIGLKAGSTEDFTLVAEIMDANSVTVQELQLDTSSGLLTEVSTVSRGLNLKEQAALQSALF